MYRFAAAAAACLYLLLYTSFKSVLLKACEQFVNCFEICQRNSKIFVLVNRNKNQSILLRILYACATIIIV